MHIIIFFIFTQQRSAGRTEFYFLHFGNTCSEPAIADKWIAWQKEEHIPEIMATGLFDSFNFFRLLEQDETDGPTYIVQYFAASREKYNQYINEHAAALRQKANDKWENQFVTFRTIMEAVK